MRNQSFILLGVLLAIAGCQGDPTSPSGPAAAPSPDMAVVAAATDSAILVVAGDMHASCVNLTRFKRVKATAAIVQRYPQALVIAMGDDAGQSSTRADFECYDKSWGAFKNRTYAAIGNHELNLDPTATPYYDYFNGVGVDSGRAGYRGRAYYTLDYGGWRILVANNHQNLDAQTAWMTRQLAASSKRCTMAIWHRPFFTSFTRTAQLQRLRPWWKVLYDGGADLVLHGHVHVYERFAKLTPDGVVDTARGIREFVVGTGGILLEPDSVAPLRGSQKIIKAWGVLKLTLWPARYKWEFIDMTGAVLDRGSDRCH
jgi:acid phosphatase type 7